MGAINHYKGTKLAQDQALRVGDYLRSANGLFCGVLKDDGRFSVYFNRLDNVNAPPPATFDPGDSVLLYETPASGPTDSYFMIMQTDGNLCIYHEKPGGGYGPALWSTETNAPREGRYDAALGDDGCLRLLFSGKPKDKTLWHSPTEVIEEAAADLVMPRLSTPSDGRLTLSALPPLPAQPAGGPALQSRGYGVSVTVIKTPPGHPNDWQVTPDQIWQRLLWLDFKGKPEQVTRGWVLINRDAGMALAWDGEGGTDMSITVTEQALWSYGGDEGIGYHAVRPMSDHSVNLNVRGDAPYQSGTPVIVWRWGGPQSNSLWRHMEAKPVPVPA